MISEKPTYRLNAGVAIRALADHTKARLGRPGREDVQIERTGSKVNLAAVNGVSLFALSVPSSGVAAAPEGLLPGAVLKACTKKDDLVITADDSVHIIPSNKDVLAWAKSGGPFAAHDPSFPPWKKVVPPSGTHVARVNPQLLIDALKGFVEAPSPGTIPYVDIFVSFGAPGQPTTQAIALTGSVAFEARVTKGDEILSSNSGLASALALVMPQAAGEKAPAVVSPKEFVEEK